MDQDKKEHLKALDDESRAKAVAKNESTFTLRAQDHSAPTVIATWISLNIETAPAEKLHQALDIAIAMREHNGRRPAD